ncbi:hypothetical protein F4778DRAFT_798899 [Xylariomycetidae sp. FL2044]|nr:hypothetical protein F4778DRAFT_798899 [Xylariomycetidae sp. FL2044]
MSGSTNASDHPSSDLEIARSDDNTLNKLPPELRFKIYEHLYADLIEELSDNLFAVFSLYEYLYNYTAHHLESHVGKTGLTGLLYTCKQIHNEALEALCNETEFVLDLLGYDDGLDEERSKIRFSDNGRILSFVKKLKLNVEPHRDETTDRFVSRIRSFLAAINHGAQLRSLKIRIKPGRSTDPVSFDKILSALGTIRTAGRPAVVSMGEVSEQLISPERWLAFVEQTNG